jgi:hypothetical protein
MPTPVAPRFFDRPEVLTEVTLERQDADPQPGTGHARRRAAERELVIQTA